MKKQELIEKLKAAGTLSSSAFIPVSDVIKMVEDLETESFELSDNIISSIAQEVTEQFDNKGTDIINDYDIDTDVSGNTIEVSLSHVSFDSYEIESIVEYAIEMYVTKKEEEEENNQ
jgi:hypothetical protein